MVPISIVIPAYNEQERLPQTLDLILGYVDRKEMKVELIVVDDGSKDRTAAIVEEYGRKRSEVVLVRNPGNRGKGYAVRNGMMAAKSDWILFSDADLSTPIEEVEKLLAAAEERGAGVAIGSRALDRSLIAIRQPAMREYSGRAFNLFMRLITGLGFQDTQCGFKLYRRSAAREIFPRQLLDGFSFDVEDLVIAKQLRIGVVEVAVRWSNAEGSKVSLSQGLRSFQDVIRIRWNALKGCYRK